MIVHDKSRGWERAEQRASVRGLQPVFIRLEGQGPCSNEFWRVPSTSRPESSHYVRVNYSAAGVAAACDCEGSLNSHICAHMAAAIRASDELHDRQPTPLPAPAPRRMTLRELLADD